MCVKCFNIDVRVYSTYASSSLFLIFLVHPGFFVILMLMYAFIVLVIL